MIEFVLSVVGNGTTIGDYYYTPWLPFYNFVPIILLVVIFFLGYYRSIYMALSFVIGSLLGLAPPYLLVKFYNIDPLSVFLVWGIFNLCISYFVYSAFKWSLKKSGRYE
jgi:hypothetical protein